MGRASATNVVARGVGGGPLIEYDPLSGSFEDGLTLGEMYRKVQERRSDEEVDFLNSSIGSGGGTKQSSLQPPAMQGAGGFEQESSPVIVPPVPPPTAIKEVAIGHRIKEVPTAITDLAVNGAKDSPTSPVTASPSSPVTAPISSPTEPRQEKNLNNTGWAEKSEEHAATAALPPPDSKEQSEEQPHRSEEVRDEDRTSVEGSSSAPRPRSLSVEPASTRGNTYNGYGVRADDPDLEALKQQWVPFKNRPLKSNASGETVVVRHGESPYKTSRSTRQTPTGGGPFAFFAESDQDLLSDAQAVVARLSMERKERAAASCSSDGVRPRNFIPL